MLPEQVHAASSAAIRSKPRGRPLRAMSSPCRQAWHIGPRLQLDHQGDNRRSHLLFSIDGGALLAPSFQRHPKLQTSACNELNRLPSGRQRGDAAHAQPKTNSSRIHCGRMTHMSAAGRRSHVEASAERGCLCRSEGNMALTPQRFEAEAFEIAKATQYGLGSSMGPGSNGTENVCKRIKRERQSLPGPGSSASCRGSWTGVAPARRIGIKEVL